MPLRELGGTGLKVSIIGFGGGHCVRPDIDEKTTVRLIQEAIDAGVTFMDNAWEYAGGESERRMGVALEGRRDKVVLMTKVCARDRITAEQQLEDSLRKLRTDVIDVWQFHEVNYDNDAEWIFRPDGAIEAAVAAREAGKVRFIGFTGHKSPTSWPGCSRRTSIGTPARCPSTSWMRTTAAFKRRHCRCSRNAASG